MKKLDFILIHAFTLDEKHEPNKIHKQRLESAFQLYKEGFGQNIVVTGKLDNRDRKYFEETRIPLSLIMKRYLAERGIPEERIYEEPEGENTYDCTINSFGRIILPNKWISGVITSSLEHLPRIIVQTRKVMEKMGIKDEDMTLFYSGPSILYSGETREEIERFRKHEIEATKSSLERED